MELTVYATPALTVEDGGYNRLRLLSQQIGTRLKRTISDVIDTGRDLIEARDTLADMRRAWLADHDGGEICPPTFEVWLEQQRETDQGFNLSYSSATNFIQAAQLADRLLEERSVNITDHRIAITDLWYLAAPTKWNTPELDAALDRLVRGEQVQPDDPAVVRTRFIRENAPAPVVKALEEGRIAPVAAERIAIKAKAAAPEVRAILDKHLIIDPDIVDYFGHMAENEVGRDELRTLADTGAVQSSDESIPLEKANSRDVRSAYGEARFIDGVTNWHLSRTVILQAYEIAPGCVSYNKTRSVLSLAAAVNVDNDEIRTALEGLKPGAGRYSLTLTYIPTGAA